MTDTVFSRTEFKAARASLGLSQVALARALHCHPHHVSNVEIGFRVPSAMMCELLRMKMAAKKKTIDPS